jgi:hypothetical protein
LTKESDNGGKMSPDLLFREVLELCYNRGLLPNEASLALAIEHATVRERERCAKIAGEYASGFDPNHREEKCGATGRDIEKRIRG